MVKKKGAGEKNACSHSALKRCLSPNPLKFALLFFLWYTGTFIKGESYLSKNTRSYKVEKRRKELKRQQKKEKKLAKRLEKSGPEKNEEIPAAEEQKEED
jgi:hypothetical protein